MKLRSVFILLIILALSAMASGQVIINEIMYNSDGTDIEFVELFNTAGTAQDVSGWYILDDNDSHQHCILSGTMTAGQYLVVVGNMTLFGVQYPAVSNINPNYFDTDGNGWSLGNGGDTVRLFDSAAQLQDMVAYSDNGDWPGSADGGGPSIELFNPLLDNALPENWDPSIDDWGTPGEQNSIYTLNVVPTCKDGSRDIGLPTANDNVTVTVVAYDSEELNRVELIVNTGAGYVAQPMSDNGLNGDSVAGDSIFTAVIAAQGTGTLVKYFARATDNAAQSDSWPNSAPAGYHAYTVDYTPPDLRITELLAVNDTGIQDEQGENDDWFEIYNADDLAVDLEGMYVSDMLNSNKMFELPAFILNPGEYLMLWADNDTEQGSWHTNFRLASGGESIAIFETVDHGNEMIHGWKFGLMSPDVSMGYPTLDSTAPEYLSNPTPDESNDSSPLFSSVCINEFLTTSNFGGPTDDWVEVYNRGNTPFDLSGCFISDERGDNTKWTFPANTILNPGEFLAIYEDVLGFNFSSEGNDVIMLTSTDSITGLDFYDFGPQDADKSEGRFPDGASTWSQFAELTDGSANSTTAVEDLSDALPKTCVLHQNYPNPFNPVTVIQYSIPTAQQVKIEVYNLMGQVVAELVNQKKTAGSYVIDFDGTHLSSGVYLYRITAGNYTQLRKMMLVK
ncbi:lamin tail domain-containing protein [bacterium]|nr:lamin tail domain-containing protein [bacterium]